MKAITEDLKNKLHESRAGLGRASWDEIFDTEQELIEAMFHEKVRTEGAPLHKLCGGYEYIKSFRKYYQKHGELTPKQMTQLKRLASEIAYRIYCVE